jgi:hypothetical protein
MGLTNDISNVYKWWKDSTEMVNAKDRFMIRGAGLLWIPLFWLLFIACIIIGTESYNKFVLYTVILPAIGFLIFGIIFSIIEINRISILNRYEQYTEKFCKDFNERLYGDYKEMVEKRVNEVLAMIRYKDKLDYYMGEKCIQDLITSLPAFEKRYFPKKEET